MRSISGGRNDRDHRLRRRPPMNKARLLTATFLVLFAAVGSWTAWWFFISSYTGRLAMAAQAEESRPRLQFAEVERFGFPLTIGFRFKDVVATNGWGDGEARISAPLAVMTAPAWRPRQTRIVLPNGLNYRLAGDGPPLAGTARYGEGTAGPAPVPTVDLELTDVTLKPPTSAPVEAKRGRIVWRAQAKDLQGVDLYFADISLSDAALFGPNAKKAEASLLLHGPLPRRGGADEIRAWRENGGKVEVAAAAVQWGALDLTAAGTVGLDAAYRLAGGLDLRIAGGDKAVAHIEKRGMLTEEGAAAAKTLLSFAALGGSGGRAQTPLVFADGKATLAGFPLAKLTPVCACR